MSKCNQICFTWLALPVFCGVSVGSGGPSAGLLQNWEEKCRFDFSPRSALCWRRGPSNKAELARCEQELKAQPSGTRRTHLQKLDRSPLLAQSFCGSRLGPTFAVWQLQSKYITLTISINCLTATQYHTIYWGQISYSWINSFLEFLEMKFLNNIKLF